MCQPPGFEEGTGNFLKLHKSLYGLKQAPRVWNQTFTNRLLSIGCVRSQSDGALFTLCLPSGSLVYLLVYVDDIQIASKALGRVQRHIGRVTFWGSFPAKFFPRVQIV
jgi:hypothetical protein